jgi:hypothetical protein
LADIPHLEAVFRRIEVEDGIVFQPDSVKGAEFARMQTTVFDDAG